MSKGDKILIDDGLVSLVVTEVKNGDIITRVENSGKVSSRKSFFIKSQYKHIAEKYSLTVVFALKPVAKAGNTSFTKKSDMYSLLSLI